LVDTIHGPTLANLKELRPGTVRILFAFDPWRSSILLVAGDKSGLWNVCYREAVPLAEQATRPNEATLPSQIVQDHPGHVNQDTALTTDTR
jgi:hypothetical protein